MCLLLSFISGADFSGIIRADKIVHDWGDVTEKDGALKCTFVLENISNSPQTITNVIKTCGCTKVTWPTEFIAPGGKAEIHVQYANDEGPHSFDKTLSVYFKGVNRPLVLHIRGVVHKRLPTLFEAYPIRYGAIGLKKSEIKVGNLSQGEEISTEFSVANLSDKDVTISWCDVDAHLTLMPDRKVVKSGSVEKIVASVKSSRALWGKNLYYATPIVSGVKEDEAICFSAVTKENFYNMSEAELKNAPRSSFEQLENCVFEVRNSGNSTLNIYKVEFDPSELECVKSVNNIEAGEKGVFEFKIIGTPTDEFGAYVATLYTDDPRHPILHFYIDAKNL